MSEELRKLAKEATPGPWEIRGDSIYYSTPHRELFYSTPHRELLANDNFGGDDGIVRVNTTGRYGRWPHDLAYLAAASPDVILGLLDRIADLERGQLDTDNLLAAFHSEFCGPHGHPAEYDRPIIERVIEAARSSSKVETGVEK